MSLSWGDEHVWIGLLQDSVAQVGDARGVDDPDQVKLGAPGLQTVQRAGAATQHHRDQADDELIEQAGLEALPGDRRPHEATSLPAAAVRACSTARWMPSVTK